MFDDGYYPQILVAEIKQDLIDFSRKIQLILKLNLKFIN
jgi:hypothetical protein